MSNLTHFKTSELPGVVFYGTLDLKPGALGKQKGRNGKCREKKHWFKSQERITSISNSAGAVRRWTNPNQGLTKDQLQSQYFSFPPGFHRFKSLPETTVGQAGQILLQ